MMKGFGKVCVAMCFSIITFVNSGVAQTWNVGSSVTATLANGTLTIRGRGAMEIIDIGHGLPWDRYKNSIINVVIENGVTDISQLPTYFIGEKTKSITVPASVTDFNVLSFGGLTINVAANHANYTSTNGVIFNKDKTILMRYPMAKRGSYTIPNSVLSIGSMAFMACTSLTSITIPNSVTYIGNLAFGHCTNLTSITIPNSVTYIGDLAFGHCTNLTSITIPSSVASIGEKVFFNCTGLTSLSILNPIPPNLMPGIWIRTMNQMPEDAKTLAQAQMQAQMQTRMKHIAETMVHGIDLTKACLYVPATSVDTYHSNEIWNLFNCIKPIGE